jgi:hypothetical protein
MSRKNDFEVNVSFEGLAEREQPPETFAYAFDSAGKFLGLASVDKNNEAKLSLPPESAGRVVRLLLGPRLRENESQTLVALARMRAYEKRFRFDPRNPKIDITLVNPTWKNWLLCPCVVRGRLVKRLTLPDGSIKELPICHARVNICEVDRLPNIILRLPDDLLVRLRDELLVAIRPPIPPVPPELLPEFEAPIPLPDPPPDFGASLRAEGLPENLGFARIEALPGLEAAVQPLTATALALASETQNRLNAIAVTSSLAELRRGLIDLSDIIRPYLCGWSWLDIFFRYRTDCFTTVTVDENGRFETVIYYPCFGDRPDLYFSAEQLHGSVWETIYAPNVRCNTHWNYECGTEVVINVTDPSAIPCAPETPVDPPSGVTTWIMPFAVGGTKIWGALPGAPAGWVKASGLTDYGGFVDAPFGNRPDGRLGFRHGYSNDIPNGIKYYRWRYRKTGATAWQDMFETVGRHYVKQSPAMLPSFPVYPLGPRTVGTQSNLFEFKPPAPPLPEPSDPPDTITYWPTDDFFADIYSGFLETRSLPPNVAGAAGQYEIKLEAFDAAGNQVMPGPGTFKFIVPTGVAADGETIIAREALPAELEDGGFVFKLHIDNNHCSAAIEAAKIGATAAADACGFLRYAPASGTPVTIEFHARHPNNFATFNFRMVRGAVFLPGASAFNQEVAALIAGPYTGDGSGNFASAFPLADLLGTCVNAAFAQRLYVFAKATTGWGYRIEAYDASALRAFALAPVES